MANKKCIIAVSGGVDSVVLLDVMVKRADFEIVVAHFDHGIRKNSSDDAKFVTELAKQYELKFEQRREDLGASASEDLARSRRYEFLFAMTKKHDAKLVTAHHLDDLVETVALNFNRGARWRGLATMSDTRIIRPLLKRTKSELIEYAVEHKLEWVEDETNLTRSYKRNKIRQTTQPLSRDVKEQIYDLRSQQLKLKFKIHQEVARLEGFSSSRYFLTMVPRPVAFEFLYDYILHKFGISLLNSQVDFLLNAIKTGKRGTIWQVGSGLSIELTLRDDIIYKVE